MSKPKTGESWILDNERADRVTIGEVGATVVELIYPDNEFKEYPQSMDLVLFMKEFKRIRRASFSVGMLGPHSDKSITVSDFNGDMAVELPEGPVIIPRAQVLEFYGL